jgi:spore maturation protein CgeB
VRDIPFHFCQLEEGQLKIVVFGLSVTSSWGNGHATTYRALLAALHRRKHKIVFFEKDEEWYASNRDLPSPEFCEVRLFSDWRSVLPAVRRELSDCDAAVLGSFFPDGVRAGQELINSNVPVKAFYDIDTPITLKNLRAGGASYLRPEQVPGFDLYLSFTAGPILEQLQNEFGAPRALPLYCSFEPEVYYPRGVYRRYECDFSYMGTYAADRQAKVDDLFLKCAQRLPNRRFILAGPQYPARLKWPKNVRRIRHLSPKWHPHFYSSSRLTLNLTRQDMVDWGFSPSVRLFEAAGCGCPIVSDNWPGLGTVLNIGEEVLLAQTTEDVISILRGADESEIQRLGNRARERILAEHSSSKRAEEFETYVASAVAGRKSHVLFSTAAAPSTSQGAAQPSS